jgi:hypothetical protein
MPDITRERRRADRRRDEQKRAERYHDQLCRVAYLVGFYGARAGHTRNADLADLVRQLDELTREPATGSS